MNLPGSALRAACVMAMAAVAVMAGHVATAAAQGTLSATCTVAGQALPCSTPWFTAPVQVVWQVSQPVTQNTCVPEKIYTFSTDQMTTLSCRVTWGDATTSSFEFPFHLEVSSPAATATPSSPPDANGWYDAPVTVGFSGNAFSGISACTPSVTYSGPATSGTTITGTCTDNAGKTATANFPLRYDATPPAVSLNAVAGDGSVALSWSASSGPAPLTAVTLTRTPGPSGPATAVIAAAASGPRTDTAVRNHVRYTYALTATDAAGNTTTQTAVVTPAARLLTPANNARVTAPPLLSWTPIPKADYYNVQLFHGSKVLSTWPKTARLQLHRSWRFDGHRHRLAKGRYWWYVWPGYGRPSKAHYGKLIGSGTFVVR